MCRGSALISFIRILIHISLSLLCPFFHLFLTPIRYNLNGLRVYGILLLATVGLVLLNVLPAAGIHDHYYSLLIAANVCGLIASAVAVFSMPLERRRRASTVDRFVQGPNGQLQASTAPPDRFLNRAISSFDAETENIDRQGGNPIYDFYTGRQFNPRLFNGRLDLKVGHAG